MLLIIFSVIITIAIMVWAAMGVGGDKTLNRREDERRRRFNEQKRLYCRRSIVTLRGRPY